MLRNVYVKNHAIDRLMDDERFPYTHQHSREKAIEFIINGVKKGKLLKINPDGSELIGYNGIIYPCIREGNTFIVKTVLKGNRFVS